MRGAGEVEERERSRRQVNILGISRYPGWHRGAASSGAGERGRGKQGETKSEGEMERLGGANRGPNANTSKRFQPSRFVRVGKRCRNQRAGTEKNFETAELD